MKYINNKKKIKRSIRKRQIGQVALLVAVTLGLGQLQTVSASKINSAQDKKNEAEAALNSANQNINEIEGQQQALQSEINALDAELVSVIMNLSILESDLAAAEIRLEEVQADLEQAKIDEKNQYEAMKMRIRFMYERGDTTMLTSILESQNITDLLNRVEYVNEVYDYDRELLISYQEAKQQVADLEVQVQGEIAEMEELQDNYLAEKDRYETMIAQKQSQMDDFDSQLANAKQLAAEYQATIDKQNEIIRQEEERQRQAEEERRRQEAATVQQTANSNSGSGSSSGGSSSGGNSGGGSSSGGSSSDSGSGGNLNPGYATSVSGSDVVSYACQFIGNPYVYGGTDINNGIDCSAYVQYVYKQFGVSLPRSSYDQRSAGKEVSYANAKAGDIICYSGHVAIYMGNGQIVHASNSAPYPAGGIKTGSATYRTIISVRRVL